MTKITLTQKKILIVLGIGVAVFFVSWILLYLPAANKVKSIKAELTRVENQIRDVETIIGEAVITGESIQVFQERLNALNALLPKKEEELLELLSSFAKKMNIELTSIRPQAKKDFLDENKNKVMIEGRVIQQVFVSMDLKCSYVDLVRYISKLKQDLPALISVERLVIDKPDSEGDALKISIQLNLYLLS